MGICKRMRTYCYTCKTTSQDFELVPFGEFNPDARRTIDSLACPCGEREELGEAYQCDTCEEFFPSEKIEEGTDDCIACAFKQHGGA